MSSGISEPCKSQQFGAGRKYWPTISASRPPKATRCHSVASLAQAVRDVARRVSKIRRLAVPRVAGTIEDHPALQIGARVGYAVSGVLHLLIGCRIENVGMGGEHAMRIARIDPERTVL